MIKKTPPTYVSWLPKAGDQVVSVANTGSGYRVYADRTVGSKKVLVEYQFDGSGRFLLSKKAAKLDRSSIAAGVVDTVTFSQDSLDVIREYNSNNEVRKLTDSNETGGLNLVKDIVQVDNAGLYKIVGSNGQRQAFVVGKARQEVVAIPNDRINVTRYRKQDDSYIVDGGGAFVSGSGDLSNKTRYKLVGSQYLVDPNGLYVLDPNNPSGPRYRQENGAYVADQYGNFAVDTTGPTRYTKSSENGQDVYKQDPAGTYIEDTTIDRYAQGPLKEQKVVNNEMIFIYEYVKSPTGTLNSDGSPYTPVYKDGGAPKFEQLKFTKLTFTPISDDLLNLHLKSDLADAASISDADTTNFVKFDQDGATPLVFLTSEVSINGKGGVVNFKTSAAAIKRVAEDVRMVSNSVTDPATGLQNVVTARINGQKLGGGVASDVLIYALDLSGQYVAKDNQGKFVDSFKDARGKNLSLSTSEKGLASSSLLLLNKDQTLWRPPDGTTIVKFRSLGSRIILNLSNAQYAIFSTNGILTKVSSSSVWAG